MVKTYAKKIGLYGALGLSFIPTLMAYLMLINSAELASVPAINTLMTGGMLTKQEIYELGELFSLFKEMLLLGIGFAVAGALFGAAEAYIDSKQKRNAVVAGPS